MLRFLGVGRFSAIRIVIQLAAVDAEVRYAVGLNREGLPGVLSRAKARMGEVFVLPPSPALVSGKLGIALLGGTDCATGIEDSPHQHLAWRAPVPRRQCWQNDVPHPSLDGRWSVL